MGKIGSLLATILLFAMAGGAWFLIIEQPSQAMENADTTVDGTVVATNIERSVNSGEGSQYNYDPEVVYRYSYEGETYTNDNIRPGSEGRVYGSHSGAEDIIDRYPNGSTVTVHVNSEDPSQSFLQEESRQLNDYFPVALLALLGVVSLLSFLGVLSSPED